MFTGIIEAIGTVAAQKSQGGDVRLYVRTGELDLSDVKLGDSIAVNGVCLTAVELTGDGFWADVSNETLTRTSIGFLGAGKQINLEKALTPQTRLGGHLVSGHVDGLGSILSIEKAARSYHIRIQAPDELAKYIAEKGSICVDGISLTVNAVEGAIFHLNIVPHTWLSTTLAARKNNDKVNLEVDLLARYVERMLSREVNQTTENQGLSETLLKQYGFK